MGTGIRVDGLSKSFWASKIWEDVTSTVPEGEVSVLPGRPSLTASKAAMTTVAFPRTDDRQKARKQTGST